MVIKKSSSTWWRAGILFVYLLVKMLRFDISTKCHSIYAAIDVALFVFPLFAKCFVFGAAFMMVGIEVRLNFITETKAKQKHSSPCIIVRATESKTDMNNFFLRSHFTSFDNSCNGNGNDNRNGIWPDDRYFYFLHDFINSDATRELSNLTS